MKNTIKLAAEFIRRGMVVDANALLKDECGVEYKEPSQLQYYALFRNRDDMRAISGALKRVADMLGCMTHTEHRVSASMLTIVGEKDTVNTMRRIWEAALRTYAAALNERVSKANVKSREEFRQWSHDYILGFFEGLTAQHSYVHPRILGLLDGLEKEKNDD